MEIQRLNELEDRILRQNLTSFSIKVGSTLTAIICWLVFPITPPPFHNFELVLIFFSFLVSFIRLTRKEDEQLRTIRLERNPYLE